MYRIHCFTEWAFEHNTPCNTYQAKSEEEIFDCLKDIFANEKSGISKITIEDDRFAPFSITSMASVDLEEEIIDSFNQRVDIL